MPFNLWFIAELLIDTYKRETLFSLFGTLICFTITTMSLLVVLLLVYVVVRSSSFEFILELYLSSEDSYGEIFCLYLDLVGDILTEEDI